MPLILSVYRTPGVDCTNDGISAKNDQLLLLNAEGPFEHLIDKMPMVILRERHGVLSLVPAERYHNRDGSSILRPVSGTMMGGNFASTSDSRFREACEDVLGDYFYGAVAIHDRIE